MLLHLEFILRYHGLILDPFELIMQFEKVSRNSTYFCLRVSGKTCNF